MGGLRHWASQRSFRVAAVVIGSATVLSLGTAAVSALTGQPADPTGKPLATPAATVAPPGPAPTASPSPSMTPGRVPKSLAVPTPAKPATPPRAVTTPAKPKPAPTHTPSKPAPKPAAKPTPKPAWTPPRWTPPRWTPPPAIHYRGPVGPAGVGYSQAQLEAALLRAGFTTYLAHYFSAVGMAETGGWNFPTTNPTGRYHSPWAIQEASNPGLNYWLLDHNLDYAARYVHSLYCRAGLAPWAGTNAARFL